MLDYLYFMYDIKHTIIFKYFLNTVSDLLADNSVPFHGWYYFCNFVLIVLMNFVLFFTWLTVCWYTSLNMYKYRMIPQMFLNTNPNQFRNFIVLKFNKKKF